MIGIRHLISHQTPHFCPIAFVKQKVLAGSASIYLILLGQEKDLNLANTIEDKK